MLQANIGNNFGNLIEVIRHTSTAKAIGPLAPAFNPDRFADGASIQVSRSQLLGRLAVVARWPLPVTG